MATTKTMRIIDRGMTVDLEDDDPRADRIRTLLFAPSPINPVATLWAECRDEHREVLVAIAKAGEISQENLEQQVGASGTDLRGLHGGLAKISKRLGVDYPIRSTGARRDSRRFSLATDTARQVLKLNTKSTNPRKKP